MRRVSTVGVVAVGVVFTAALMPFDVASASGVGWRQFEFDPAHSGHNRAESLLSPSNVNQLTLAYSTHGLKGAAVTQPVVLGNVAYMGAGYLVVAFDVATGAHIWTHPTCAGSGQTTMPALAGGRVWVGDDHGYLSAFDAMSGERTLCTRVGPMAAPPSTAGGTVYAATERGVVAAFDGRTGTKLWMRKLTAGDVLNTPAVAGEFLFLSTQQTGGARERLYKLRASTGQVVWRRSVIGTPLSSPTIRGTSVYVGGTGLFCFDVGTGALQWHAKGLGGVSGPAVADGTLFVGTEDNTPFPGGIAAIDPSTGARLWYRNDGAFFAPLTVANGVIYVIQAETPTAMDMVDQRNGAIIAQRFSPSDPFANYDSGAGVTVLNGMVFAPDANVSRLDAWRVASRGRLLRTRPLRGSRTW